MKFYLAGRYERKEEFKGYEDDLLGLGHQSTSSWLHQPHSDEENATFTAEGAKWAERDLRDILNCQTFIAFTEYPDACWPRGSRHVEFGYALAQYKRVITIGPNENLFTLLPRVLRFGAWDEFRFVLEMVDHLLVGE